MEEKARRKIPQTSFRSRYPTEIDERLSTKIETHSASWVKALLGKK